MKTLLKFMCWFLRIPKETKSILVVKKGNNSYSFINGKMTVPNPISGCVLSIEDQKKLNKIVDEYFLLLDKNMRQL